ncbi:MAG TPA: hypothetical protein VHU40_05810, partial [Polyangia bacterium]|nr:hypothetical protein [Polyangia bacterium]
MGTFVWLRHLALPSLMATQLGCGIAKPPGVIEVDAGPTLDAGAVVDTPVDVAQEAGEDADQDAG